MAEDELWKTLLRFHREVVKPDTAETLMRFHREVVKPDMETMREEIRGEIRSLRNEMLNGFDGVYHRIERVETELAAITIGLKRLEAQVSAIERRLSAVEDKMALRSELAELEEQMASLNQRITEIKKQLN